MELPFRFILNFSECIHYLFSDDLNIVASETVPVRMFSGNQYGNHETTYSWNRGEQQEVWLLILRIFVDGSYVNPPPDMLPPPVPLDKPKTGACCVIL